MDCLEKRKTTRGYVLVHTCVTCASISQNVGRRNVVMSVKCVITLGLLEGCLTVHLPHEIMWKANLMQHGNFIDIFLARHVSGTYAQHQQH